MDACSSNEKGKVDSMKLIKTSLQIALRAYAGKTDKAGREYILHPLRVMAKMNTDLERSAALLHDVIEDSDITPEELLAEGMTIHYKERPADSCNN